MPADPVSVRPDEPGAAAAQGFEDGLRAAAAAIDSALDTLLPPPDGPGRLGDAMRYAALAPGKRLRPFLTLSAAHLFDVPETRAIRVGAAIECVHAYSLVHDDLPAMDDDDLRRGRPTVHIAFDEATAILAGDALLTLAFEIMTAPDTHPDGDVRAELVRRLAQNAGWNGMVGGQVLDLLAEHEPFDEEAIRRMQKMKTGALIAYACEAGALLGGADQGATTALLSYAYDLGLAFQIQDDLLDATANADALGKAAGKDADRGKATFISILGLERAREEAASLVDSAVASLDRFDARADPLRAAAEFVIKRSH